MTQTIQQYIARLLAHDEALTHYSVFPLPIPIHLFIAQEKPINGEKRVVNDPLLGWGAVLPNEKIHGIPVPGSHLSMMDVHVSSLGRALTQAIHKITDQRLKSPPEMNYCPQLTIQTSQSQRPPIFCIPGAGDNVTGFVSLADALDEDWPLHGLQPRGVEGELVPYTSVETAAVSYIRTMDAIQHNGPVHLLGHSFGGWVAYEVAAYYHQEDHRIT